MALNFAGFPLGSALAGAIVPISIELAIVFAVVANCAGAAVAYFALPRDDGVAGQVG
jgi:hypothetical protein